jgi:hypothetical protein
MNGIKLSSQIEDSGKIQRHSGAIIRDTRKSRETRGDSERFYRRDFSLRKCLPFNADFLFHGLGSKGSSRDIWGKYRHTGRSTGDIQENPWTYERTRGDRGCVIR